MRNTFQDNNGALNDFLEEWCESYAEEERSRFNRDGIVDEDCYLRQTHRILYVCPEPNGGKNGQYVGCDLREILRCRCSGMPFDKNLIRWTRVLLDGETEFFDPCSDDSWHVRRVAVINLKKLCGGGIADRPAIEKHAWESREFIRRQVGIIAPTLVVTCGDPANKFYRQIVFDDRLLEVPARSVWEYKGVRVLPAYHPSCRPRYHEKAFERLVELAREWSVGAFGN